MTLSLTRPPRSRDELYWLVKALWNITIPRHKVCPDHDAPFDAFATAYFTEEPQVLIHGSRGLSGKSRLLSILGLTKAAVSGADVNILGGSLNQSINIHNTIRKAWESKNAPTYILQDESATRIKLTNGAVIMPLTASQKTVRGPHPPILLLDEIDEMDQDIFDAAKGQPMPQPNWAGEIIRPHTAMSSTWQYPDKTFANEYRRFQEQDLPIFTWCLASDSLVTTARGEVPIQEVTTEDRVLTRYGFRDVQHVTFMGYKPTVDLQIGGRTLRLTPDHRVGTPDGWRDAHALAADTVSPVGPNPHVLGCELVPLPAMRGLGLVPVGAGLVDTVGDDLAVDSVHTGPVPADVVQGHPIRDGSDYVLEDPAVGLHGRVLSLGLFESVPVALVSRPVDAVGEHGHILAPVWDIGVEDTHEFVAEGVVVHNCYRDTANPVDGWLDADTIAQKRREIPSEMWRVEYDLGEPSIGNRAIDTEAVERMFDLDVIGDEHVVKIAKDYEEYKFAEYKHTGDYVISADWAKEQDFTVITVWDVTQLPMRLVYYTRMRRRPYPVMVGKYNDLMGHYNAAGIHDGTGVGNAVADYLDIRARGFVMTGAKRDNMLTEYVSAVENDKVRAYRIGTMYKAHKYVSVDDLYSRKEEFHLPDEVCSAALAWNIVNKRALPVIPIGIEAVNDPYWMEREVRNNTSTRKAGQWEEGKVRIKDEEESKSPWELTV